MRSVATVLLAVLAAVGLVTGDATVAGAAPAGGRTSISLGRLYVDGRGGAETTVVGDGARVRLVPTLSWRYSTSVSRPRIGLQRLSSGRWIDVGASSITVPSDLRHDDIVVWTSPYRTSAAAQTVQYRLISRPYASASGQVVNTSTSRAFAVRYENQATYTGLRREEWLTVQRYCPVTAVRVGPISGGDAAGEWTSGTLLLRIDPTVAGYPEASRRTVALHECAHERQWANYGSTNGGWTRMEHAAKRIYVDDSAPGGSSEPSVKPFDAVEHGADCAAKALDPGGYLGYGGYCDPRELAAGRRLMAGHRY